MAKKNATINIDETDWLEPQTLVQAAGGTRDLFEKHFREGRIKIQLEVILPPGADAGEAEDGAQRVVREHRKKIKDAFITALREAFAELAANNPKGPENAHKLVDAANKYTENLLKKFRGELRRGIAKSMSDSLKADDLQTVGDTSFKKIKSVGGEFDVGEVELGGNLLDIKDSLGKSGWQHCAVAMDAKEARLAIDKSAISASDQKLLKKAHPGRTAAVVAGRYNGKEEQFEFLESDQKRLRGNYKKVATWLRDAIKTQADKSSNPQVVFVPEFTADQKKGVKESKDDESGKPSKKGKEKEKSDKGKKEK